MEIVDFHSHFFSRPFFEALASLAPGPESAEERLTALSQRTGIELPPPDVERHLARWLGELDSRGVDHLVSFASVPPEAPALARARELAGGRLSVMALLDPTAEGAAERARALLGEQGFSGLLVFPATHHFHLGEERVRAVLEVLAEHRAILYVHCGLLVVKLRDLLGLPRTHDLTFANPLAVIPAADRHRDVRFVIPHFGAGLLRETLMAGSQCANVYVDTSSSNSWVATQPARTSLTQVFERALGVFGAGRILFGTDSGPFPAGWRADRLAEQSAVLDELGISDADRARILGGNARELLSGVRA